MDEISSKQNMFEHSHFGKIADDDFGISMKKLFDQIQACSRCECSKKDCNIFSLPDGTGKVPFSFNRGSILLVGESPNSRRMQSPLALIPFCLDWELQKNKSGEILKMMMDENSLDMKNFCSTNLVKCSVFSDEEFESSFRNCERFFDDALQLVEPLLIVGLGERVRKALGGKMSSFTEYVTHLGYKYKMVCIKHPAWVLRDRQENLKAYRVQFKLVAEWIKAHTARQMALNEKFGIEVVRRNDDTKDEALNF